MCRGIELPEISSCIASETDSICVACIAVIRTVWTGLGGRTRIGSRWAIVITKVISPHIIGCSALSTDS